MDNSEKEASADGRYSEASITCFMSPHVKGRGYCIFGSDQVDVLGFPIKDLPEITPIH